MIQIKIERILTSCTPTPKRCVTIFTWWLLSLKLAQPIPRIKRLCLPPNPAPASDRPAQSRSVPALQYAARDSGKSVVESGHRNWMPLFQSASERCQAALVFSSDSASIWCFQSLSKSPRLVLSWAWDGVVSNPYLLVIPSSAIAIKALCYLQITLLCHIQLRLVENF